MTDEEFRTQVDREAAERARDKRGWPDLKAVRRVRVDDEGPTPYQARVDRERREAARETNGFAISPQHVASGGHDD